MTPPNHEPIDDREQRKLAEERGHWLRNLREELGITQAQLAGRIGIGKQQISRIERGDLDNMRLGTMRAHANALGAQLWVSAVLRDERTRVG